MDTNFTRLIESWPTDSVAVRPTVAFARDIGVTVNHAKQMRRRDAINPRFWLLIVEAARRRGLDWVTLELLAEISARKGASDVGMSYGSDSGSARINAA